MPEIQRVLFVCTGNICRSPTADGILRHMVREQGLEDRIEVDSAGTIAYHEGEPADARSAEAAARRGYDLSPLRARALRPGDYDAFQWILAMHREHMTEMRAQAPAERHERLHMFRDFCEQHGPGDVPDPYYGGGRGFEEVLDMVEDGCRGLLARILEKG